MNDEVALTKCGHPGFSYRGLCEQCAPELHRQYRENEAAWLKVFEAYKAESGKEPLADWDAFENWIEWTRR